MPPELEEVRRWMIKAQHDWTVARNVVAAGGPETDVAAFHCQQAIEKLLKGYLVYQGLEFEKAHDLGRLLDHCKLGDAEFEALRVDVEPLTLYAVAYRYPGPADPSLEKVRSALTVVEKVWNFMRARLPKDPQE